MIATTHLHHHDQKKNSATLSKRGIGGCIMTPSLLDQRPSIKPKYFMGLPEVQKYFENHFPCNESSNLGAEDKWCQ